MHSMRLTHLTHTTQTVGASTVTFAAFAALKLTHQVSCAARVRVLHPLSTHCVCGTALLVVTSTRLVRFRKPPEFHS